ncbi:E3 ubiquitin-protein ligase RNF12-A-like [Ornithodoros turicata]|uniref:E3 ubiquitin-protein ligase RNF12-A-like n=1 Tax=Ornithodoros turicata TaxID=34597 RepID=UPI003138627E
MFPGVALTILGSVALFAIIWNLVKLELQDDSRRRRRVAPRFVVRPTSSHATSAATDGDLEPSCRMSTPTRRRNRRNRSHAICMEESDGSDAPVTYTSDDKDDLNVARLVTQRPPSSHAGSAATDRDLEPSLRTSTTTRSDSPHRNRDGEDMCIICRENFNGTGIHVTYDCGHTFHLDCMETWCEDNDTCPTCGARIVPPAVFS